MAQEEKTKKKNRLSYMILSVIIAIIAWILVVYITDPEITKKFTGIPVEITGENVLAENGFVIVNRDEIPNTSLKMSGRRSDLIKSLDKARVVIDVSQIKDEGEIELETSAKGAKAGVSIEKIGAEMISVSIEKIQSKVVPVRVVQIGTPKNGLVKTEPSDATVEIKGATSELDLVEAVEVKMDITNVLSNEKRELQYSLILKDGVVAFSCGSASGVILAKIINIFSKEKINPLIGSAGVSAVPMAARVSQSVGQKYNPGNFLLMHAMGPNVAGVIGSAVAAGILLAFLPI